MALLKHIKHVVALGAVVCATSALAVSCGDDTTEDKDDDKTDAGATGGSDLADGVAGAACTKTADCAGTGATCATQLGVLAMVGLGSTAPGGYCTASCSTNAECGDGVCVGAFGQALKGQCQRGCSVNADCSREGYACGALNLEELAGAAGDAGLPIPDAGPLPELSKGCVPTPEHDELANGIVGEQCDSDTDCGDGVCNTMQPITNTPIPGGYCSGKCLEDAHCGAKGLCLLALQNQFIQRAGDCVKTCTSNTDCVTPGYICGESPAQLPAGTPRVCAPPPPADAGTPPVDAGNTTDAGTDAGTPDAGDEEDAA